MREEIRMQRLKKHGAITYCEQEAVLCFGCLTEDGKCKYEKCLHENAEWIELQQRIEAKRNAPKVEIEHKPIPKNLNEALWKSIRQKEAKAEALYRAGETKEANRLMKKAKKARMEIWEREHRKEDKTT